MDHFDDTSHRAQLSPSLSLSLIVLNFSITALLLLSVIIALTAMTMVMTMVGFLLTALSYQFTKILVPTGVRLCVLGGG